MPRKLRIQYAGAMYHIMSRGDRGEPIFLDDVDRHDFIKTLAEACQKTDWQVHAYCLLSHRQAADAKAERIIAEELRRNGWCERDFLWRRKKDPIKLAIAARLRRETTLSLKAVAARLSLGTSKSANSRLHGFMKTTDRANSLNQIHMRI